MATVNQAMTRIESHEKECIIRYTNIEKRLNEGNKRFDKLEGLIWAIYPFILITLVIPKVLQ